MQNKHTMGERFFVFQQVPRTTTHELVNAKDKGEVQEIFSQVFQKYFDSLQGKEESQVDFSYKKQIVLDLLFSTLDFATDNNFKDDKISCLIEIVFRVFEDSMQKKLSSEAAYAVAKEYLLRHTSHRPPYSIILFSLDEVKLILKHLKWSFFRYYTNYVKAFIPQFSYALETFVPARSDLPENETLVEGSNINKDHYSILDMFNKDKEIILTKEEIEEIMRGNSIHTFSEAQKQKIIQQHLEKQRIEKVNLALQKELDKLLAQFNEQIAKQDQEFAERFDELKKKKIV